MSNVPLILEYLIPRSTLINFWRFYFGSCQKFIDTDAESRALISEEQHERFRSTVGLSWSWSFGFDKVSALGQNTKLPSYHRLSSRIEIDTFQMDYEKDNNKLRLPSQACRYILPENSALQPILSGRIVRRRDIWLVMRFSFGILFWECGGFWEGKEVHTIKTGFGVKSYVPWRYEDSAILFLPIEIGSAFSCRLAQFEIIWWIVFGHAVKPHFPRCRCIPTTGKVRFQRSKTNGSENAQKMTESAERRRDHVKTELPSLAIPQHLSLSHLDCIESSSRLIVETESIFGRSLQTFTFIDHFQKVALWYKHRSVSTIQSIVSTFLLGSWLASLVSLGVLMIRLCTHCQSVKWAEQVKPRKKDNQKIRIVEVRTDEPYPWFAWSSSRSSRLVPLDNKGLTACVCLRLPSSQTNATHLSRYNFRTDSNSDDFASTTW